MSLRYLIWSYAAPGNLLALGLAAGVLFRGFGRGRLGRLLIGLSALGFVAFLVLPLGRWAIDPLENRFPIPNLTQPVEGILLLTGAIDVRETVKRGQPIFSGYAERVTATAALAHRFPEARILVSGGSFDPALPSEAAEHRDLLVAMGVDGTRILTEEHARNTCESPRFSRQQIGAAPGERWLLVTSAFHMPRAIACFRHAGWNIVPYPAGYLDRGSGVFSLVGNLHVFDLALHEWVGLVAYRLLGETDEIFPVPDANDTAAPKRPPVAAMSSGGG